MVYIYFFLENCPFFSPINMSKTKHIINMSKAVYQQCKMYGPVVRDLGPLASKYIVKNY